MEIKQKELSKYYNQLSFRQREYFMAAIKLPKTKAKEGTFDDLPATDQNKLIKAVNAEGLTEMRRQIFRTANS